MKTTKLLSLILLISALFSACNQDEVMPIQNVSKDTEPILYEELIPVFSSSGEKAATLKFTSISSEDLKGLSDFEFVAVKTESNQYTSLEMEGNEDVGFSAAYQNARFSESDKNPTELLPEGINVDLIPEASVDVITIEVKSKMRQKKIPAYQSASLVPTGTKQFLYGNERWRRVQIENLSTYPLYVEFWYYVDPCQGGYCTIRPGDPRGPFTGHTGFDFTLRQNRWAYYYNCGRGVAALVTVRNNNPWHFRWTWWSNCRP